MCDPVFGSVIVPSHSAAAGRAGDFEWDDRTARLLSEYVGTISRLT
ncbi:hypothetical protein [Azospirillum endophyticum]